MLKDKIIEKSLELPLAFYLCLSLKLSKLKYHIARATEASSMVWCYDSRSIWRYANKRIVAVIITPQFEANKAISACQQQNYIDEEDPTKWIVVKFARGHFERCVVRHKTGTTRNHHHQPIIGAVNTTPEDPPRKRQRACKFCYLSLIFREKI